VFRRNKELWYALAAIVIITAAYSAYIAAVGLLPAASNLVGHGLGILGFVLMLMTETLYTLRKRAKSARWGRVSSWLKFHIFTGLVGPYLVLLHPAMKFRGVAAVLTLLTAVVVASGVVGRYLYTRMPRTAASVSAGARGAVSPDVAAQGGMGVYAGLPEQVSEPGPAAEGVPAGRKALATWRAVHVPLTFVLFGIALVHIVGAVYYATLLR
jgi:hypothetical protein